MRSGNGSPVDLGYGRHSRRAPVHRATGVAAITARAPSSTQRRKRLGPVPFDAYPGLTSPPPVESACPLRRRGFPSHRSSRKAFRTARSASSNCSSNRSIAASREGRQRPLRSLSARRRNTRPSPHHAPRPGPAACARPTAWARTWVARVERAPAAMQNKAVDRKARNRPRPSEGTRPGRRTAPAAVPGRRVRPTPRGCRGRVARLLTGLGADGDLGDVRT